ncbi:MAG: hypothetical protein JSS99_15745 [Actinobacteria bacterium]|nr:hypothetical protein [Actinomycetota bacterium]
MAVTATQVQVPDRSALDGAITSYIAQGFTVQNRGEDFVVLFKKKEFSVLWAVVGFVLCVLPLLVYLIVYATQKDQLVEIRVAASQSQIHWSADREQWWDGEAWHHVSQQLPPDAQVSPDGAHFWDGASWRTMPAGAPAAEADALSESTSADSTEER